MVVPRLVPLTLPLLVASCGPAAGSSPAALAPASVAIPPAPLEAPAPAADGQVVDPSAPLTLPVAALPPATWVEPPLGKQERARARQDPFLHQTEMALGERVAIIAAKGGGADPTSGAFAFAVDEKHGVVGPLKLPARFTWVGVAGPQIDALYAATPDGALHRAAGVRDALKPDGFVPRGSVPGATAWDAAGGLIAAAAGERVSVSADEGRSFISTVVAPGKTVRAVLVRPDGVLAAVVEARTRSPAAPDTFLSVDHGQTWKRSAFQPRSIKRMGSLIWNGDASCPAVLSRDGQAWTRSAAPIDALYARPTLGTALRLSSSFRATAAGSFRSAIAPPAPEPPPRGRAAVGREPPCKADNEGVIGGIAGGLLGAPGVHCEGAFCLLEGTTPLPQPTRTRIATFGDGICAPASVRPPGSTCAAQLTRPPTFAVVDPIGSTVTPVAAPEGCPMPVALHNAAGIGVLICLGGSGGVDLFVRGAQGPWHAEGSQAIPAEALKRIAAAPDGTLLLLGPTPPPASDSKRWPLQALVRSPLPLGTPQAWRGVTAPDGVAALPAPGGAALLASSPVASAGRRLNLRLDLPGQPALLLARDVEVHQQLTQMDVQDGQVRFRVRPKPAPEVQGRSSLPPPEPQEARWHVLTHGDELVQETPSAPRHRSRSAGSGPRAASAATPTFPPARARAWRGPTTSRTMATVADDSVPPPPESALPEKKVHPPAKRLVALAPRGLAQQLDRWPTHGGVLEPIHRQLPGDLARQGQRRAPHRAVVETAAEAAQERPCGSSVAPSDRALEPRRQPHPGLIRARGPARGDGQRRDLLVGIGGERPYRMEERSSAGRHGPEGAEQRLLPGEGRGLEAREQAFLIQSELPSKPVEERRAVLVGHAVELLELRLGNPRQSGLLPGLRRFLGPVERLGEPPLNRFLAPGVRRPRFQLQLRQQRLAGIPVLPWIPIDQGRHHGSTAPRVRRGEGPLERELGVGNAVFAEDERRRADVLERCCPLDVPLDRGEEVGIARFIARNDLPEHGQ